MSKIETDFDVFRRLARLHLRFLVEEYGFKEVEAKFLFPGMWLKFRNSVTSAHVTIDYEYGSGLWLTIGRLTISTGGVTDGEHYNLDYLLNLRAPAGLDQFKYLPVFDEAAVSEILQERAGVLREYAADVLRGDLGSFRNCRFSRRRALRNDSEMPGSTSDLRIQLQLQAPSTADYLRSPIPNVDDDRIRAHINQRVTTADLARPSELSERDSWVLLSFAERMASLAVREASQERIMEGLTALALEGGDADFPRVWWLLRFCGMRHRESLAILSLVLPIVVATFQIHSFWMSFGGSYGGLARSKLSTPGATPWQPTTTVSATSAGGEWESIRSLKPTCSANTPRC